MEQLKQLPALLNKKSICVVTSNGPSTFPLGGERINHAGWPQEGEYPTVYFGYLREEKHFVHVSSWKPSPDGHRTVSAAAVDGVMRKMTESQHSVLCGPLVHYWSVGADISNESEDGACVVFIHCKTEDARHQMEQEYPNVHIAGTRVRFVYDDL